MAKIDVISTAIIKPSSPTPPHLKSFKFSLLDQLAPSIYTPLLLFYREKSTDVGAKLVSLKSALSESLTLLYPLAGRFVGNASIDCDDEGVPFVEARIRCSLSDVLDEPHVDFLKRLLPTDIESEESATTGRPLYIRVNVFDCGGIAIGVCASHKITDAATLSIFVRLWASAARSRGYADELLPKFIGTSLFPPTETLASSPVLNLTPQVNVTNRFFFDALSIKRLRSLAGWNGESQPTRVETVSAIIWRCAMKTRQRASILTQTVNIRKRLDPPLQENTIGNFVSYYAAEKDHNDETDLNNLINKMKKGAKEFNSGYLKKLQGKERASAVLEAFEETAGLFSRTDVDFYSVTSWCRFKLYDADFGWGKPIWVSIANSPFNNVIVLMDAPDGAGIEAWVTLKEGDMAMLEQDKELLAFASLNPSVSDN